MENEFLIVAVVFWFAAFTQGYSGFGFQLISISVLSMLFNPIEIIPLCAMFGLVINIYLSINLRNHINIKELIPLLIGAALGIPIGLIFLKTAAVDLIKMLIGIIIISYVFVSSTKQIANFNLSAKWSYVFGLFSGILGGAFNTNGPPIIIYFLLKRWDGNKFKAMISFYFLFSSIMIVVGHALTELTTQTILKYFFYFFPFVFFGNLIGANTFGIIPTKYFNNIVKILLLLISIRLIIA